LPAAGCTQHSRGAPALAHAPRPYFLVRMSITDYEMKAIGATYGARYGASDDNGWVWVPIGAKILSAVGQTQFLTGEEKDDHIAVPLWVLAALVDGAFEPSELGLYASDSFIKSTVIGATLKDAEDKGFYIREGKRQAWHSLEAHAHDFTEFAAAQRAAGNPEPYIVEEADFYTLIVPAWPAGHPLEMLNSLVVTDLEAGDKRVSTKLAWLLHPITPSPDLSDGTEAYMVLMHLLSTAKTHQPGLANISLRLAVSRLMHVPLPYQLANVGISLMDRISYVSRLEAWADTSRRSSIIQGEFSMLLDDLTSLAKWVRTAVGPFQQAMTLAKGLGGDSTAIDVDTFVILDAKLAKLVGAWRDGCSAEDNIAFLLSRHRRNGTDGGTVPRGADGTALSAMDGGVEHLARMGALDSAIKKWAAEGTKKDPMEGITIIFESGVSPAIRWLTGSGSDVAALPPAFRSSCELLPGKLDEYIVDCLRHDEDGNADADLEELSVRTLYIRGANTLAAQRAFFGHLAANRFTSIDWEKMLIAPLWALMCPGQSARVWTMAEVYSDPERMALHEMYVSRALAAVGKIGAAANSYAALIGEWAPSLARAKRGGVHLAADCIDNVIVLMNGAWASAEAIGVASLKGEHYNPSLFDSSISEVVNWRSFQEGMAPMKQLVSRYKRTLASLLQPTQNTGSASTQPQVRGVTDAGEGAGSGSALAAPSHGGGKTPPIPMPASRVTKMVTVDGWTAATEFSEHWYHQGNCRALAASRFNCKNACVMSIVTKGAPIGHESEWALAYCDKGHAADAPEHSLIATRAEYVAAMDAGMHQYRPRQRRGSVESGKVVEKRQRTAGSGKRPFLRQTARP
jgi:hypothetical protein